MTLVSIERISRLAAEPTEACVLDLWVDPEVAFETLCGDSDFAYWLDAGPDAASGWSFIGDLRGAPDAYVLTGNPDLGRTEVLDVSTGRESWTTDGVLDVVAGTFPERRVSGSPGSRPGWVGWVGYESGAVRAGATHAHVGRPESVLLFSLRQLAFDHLSHRVTITSRFGDPWSAAMAVSLQALAGVMPSPPPAPRPIASTRARHSADEYRSLIDECKRRIFEGDAYQICLTNSFETSTDENPLTIYRRLRRENPSRNGGFIRADSQALLSSSPEVFLALTAEGDVTTRPIKGTRKRGSNEVEDEGLRTELMNDEKELAENLMIVDLMRNDLAAVCDPGSVGVSELFTVEVHPNVLQLVSAVVGTLRTDCTSADLLRSTFPAGSMTGAPKQAAMRILHSLEGGPRGAYAGAYGYFAVDGSAQLAMTIRTIVLDGHRVLIGSGGGITALSDRDFELEETYTKIRPLLRALGSRLGR